MDRLLRERGAQQKLAEEMGTFASVVLRWRRGDQKPDAGNRVLLRERFSIALLAWDEAPETSTSPTEAT